MRRNIKGVGFARLGCYLAAALLLLCACGDGSGSTTDSGPGGLDAGLPAADGGRSRDGGLGPCEARSFKAGTNPTFVALADMNLDGSLDIVVANANGAAVSILHGKGNGDFPDPVTVSVGPVGAFPSAVAVGDFNKDGIPDLAVANSGTKVVAILLGQAGGAPKLTSTFQVGPTPKSLRAADVNGDGNLDLVVLNANEYMQGETSVGILIGKGDGSFLPQVAYPVASGPRALVVADLDRDGHLDVAVGASSAIYVLRGSGSGSLDAPTTVQATGFVYGLVAADLSQDGSMDLAAAVASSALRPLTILPGESGSWPSHVEYGAGTVGKALALGDLNRDGVADLVVVAERDASTSVASVFLGVGDGTFAAQADFPLAPGTSSVAVGDVDGDGQLEIVANDWGGNAVTVLSGRCYP